MDLVVFVCMYVRAIWGLNGDGNGMGKVKQMFFS